MPTQRTEHLIQLINSLTKAEKRSFRLFVTRNQESEEILFLKLFEEISKSKTFDEESILNRIPAIKRHQLSNLKAHLYKQLLICLRLLARNTTVEIDLRERIDYAHILYGKGLYRQALDVLSKAKTVSLKHGKSLIALSILHFEEFIESQYITRSLDNRVNDLKRESRILLKEVEIIRRLSNFSLQLYGLYLNVGHVRNEHDQRFLKNFFESNLPDHDPEELDFFGKTHLYQAYMWYHYMNHDFIPYYRYARRWFDLFESNPAKKKSDTALYLKCLHNLLNALFMMERYDRFLPVLTILKEMDREGLIKNRNEQGMHTLFGYIQLINKHFMTGTFSEGVKEMPELVRLIDKNPFNWDQHRIIVFYYKIACMYFGSSDWSTAITYLNKITNTKSTDFRTDIQSFAKILNLIAHFELGNKILLEYQVKSVYRYLGKVSELQSVQLEIFKFLRKVPRMSEDNVREQFELLHTKLKKMEGGTFERRAYLYLDIISWLESKLERRPVEDIIREKFLQRSQTDVTAKASLS
ncbi:MAG: hypothetical protein KTR24_18375 [Saprospiraceae bacterium]|nr:hypothetical protein [Saprospiraceae bacterium]